MLKIYLFISGDIDLCKSAEKITGCLGDKSIIKDEGVQLLVKLYGGSSRDSLGLLRYFFQ